MARNGDLDFNRPYYVYVIGYDDGVQKVGFSRDPQGRAKTLRPGGNPTPSVHHARQVKAEDVRGVEALAHWILRKSRKRLEFFDVPVADAIKAVDLAADEYASGVRAPTAKELNPTSTMTVRLPLSTWALIEEWRRHEPDLPRLSEALRRMVERGCDIAAVRDAKAKSD